MRSERLPVSTPDLDAAEVEWWNRFSPLAERVWAFDDSLSAALRGRYMARAAAYMEAGPSGPSTVLDLGCGSGATSRFLAGHGVRVVGVDSSSAQVGLARELARSHPRADLMEFRVADSGELTRSPERFQGVVTHAFLHHLASDELDRLLATISGLLVPAGRAWFYEPVFFEPGRRSPGARVTMIERRSIYVLGRLLRALGLLSDEVQRGLDQFSSEAASQGYFLSPKEVPFSGAELTEAVERYFEVDSIRWETGAAYQLASLVSQLERRKLRELGCRPVRAAAWIDDRMGARGGLETLRGLSAYGFAGVFARSRRD